MSTHQYQRAMQSIGFMEHCYTIVSNGSFFVFQVVWNFVREESFKSETLASGSSTDKFIARHPVVLGQVGFGTPRFGEVNATLIIKAASLADTKASDFKLMFDPAYLDLRITL